MEENIWIFSEHYLYCKFQISPNIMIVHLTTVLSFFINPIALLYYFQMYHTHTHYNMYIHNINMAIEWRYFV